LVLLIFTAWLYRCICARVQRIWCIPEKRTSPCPAFLQLAKNVQITASFVGPLAQFIAHLVDKFAESLSKGVVVHEVILEVIQYPVSQRNKGPDACYASRIRGIS
jgi:hypothetical protein